MGIDKRVLIVMTSLEQIYSRTDTRVMRIFQHVIISVEAVAYDFRNFRACAAAAGIPRSLAAKWTRVRVFRSTVTKSSGVLA
jgi:hypothetical protein